MSEETRKAFLEILAIASPDASTSSQAANPTPEQRLEMIVRIAKRRAGKA